MVACPECGARNAENSTFCVRCGEALVVAATFDQETVGEDTAELSPVVVEPEALLAEAADLLGEGKVEAAIGKCRQALDLAPDMGAAYSLIGMAEEQRGNLSAAADAYRCVLEIDPGRSVEREKLEFICQQMGLEEPVPGEATEPPAPYSEPNWVTQYAPYIAVAAAALCVLMILTGVFVRARVTHRIEQHYEQQMAVGRQSLDKRDYEAAVRAFEAALEARPQDRDAEQGLRYAQRKLVQTRTPRTTSRGQPAAHMAEIVPSVGPNPFAPRAIRPQEAPAPEVPQSRRASRPPVVNWTGDNPDPTGSGTTSSTVLEEEFARGPLEEPADEEPGAGNEPPAAREEPPAPPERPRGEISIWVSEAPATYSQGASPPPISTDTGTADPGARARSLRDRADALRRQGKCQEAAGLYSQAIEAYRAASHASPRSKPVNDSAIGVCERALSLCQTSQGQ